MNRHIAAPVPMKIGERTYLLSPLTLRDFRELENYLQTLPIQRARRMIDLLPAEDRRLAIERALNEADEIRLGTAKFDREAQTLDGLVYMFWLCLRHGQPQITLEQAEELLHQAGVDVATQTVNQLAGFEENPTATGKEAGP